PEIPRFEVGKAYVIIAKRLVDRAKRQHFGLGPTEPIAYGPVNCSDPETLGRTIADDLGPSKPPTDAPARGRGLAGPDPRHAARWEVGSWNLRVGVGSWALGVDRSTLVRCAFPVG